MAEPIIDVKNVTKRFKTTESGHGGGFLSSIRRKYVVKTALDGVSMSIGKGEIVALLGRNGSGKSTLVKIMAGIMLQDGGSVSVMGMNPWAQRIEMNKRMGVVLGAHNLLYWNLPPIDTFELVRHIYSIPKDEYEKRLEYFIDIFELKDVVKRQTRSLSLGERMKCNAVTSLLHVPDVVIMDEPTIGVDLPSRSALKKVMLDMRRRYGTTFLLTTHVVDDILVSDRIIVMDHGKMLFDGSKDKLRNLIGGRIQVDLYLSEKQPRLGMFRFGKVVRKAKGHMRLEVDPGVLKDKRFVALLGSKDILDYRIAEPGLSYVLSRVFEKRKAAERR